jgi:hypothetical protein
MAKGMFPRLVLLDLVIPWKIMCFAGSLSDISSTSCPGAQVPRWAAWSYLTIKRRWSFVILVAFQVGIYLGT